MFSSLFKKTPSISTEELQGLLRSRPQIIDVREPYEFRNGHIPGAKNVPLGTVAGHAVEGRVYVICASGSRSGRATKMLLKKGVDAVNVTGGMMLWKGKTK